MKQKNHGVALLIAPEQERIMRTVGVYTGLLMWMLAPAMVAAPKKVSFSQPPRSVDVYDFVEITVNVEGPDASNPFTDATLRGSFGKVNGADRTAVEGFCDSADGGVFRIRFMPSSPGDYTCSIAYRQGSFETNSTGTFKASEGHRRGPIRVDPKYPWHFIWEGTGEHYFFNGTTAFWLAGWKEDRVINYCIERLSGLKINRIRVLLAGAANIFWGEPVMTGDNFTYFLRPWLAQAPNSFDHPSIDFTRFNVPYWQKWERMLRFARERNMIVSVIQDISTHKAQPAAGSEDERRYLRYAAARLGAFSNITWDLGDDLDSFRDEKWAHETGTLLESWDPYKHLASSHPVHRENQDRSSDWFGFTSIQNWSRRQHELMLEERQIQIKTGRTIPQTNEEYGYEDHYPHWAPAPDGESAETLRRVAWDIAMAGAYGTAGESSRRGTNIWPDAGGGWINGRGDDTMIMLKGYEHMVDFFTSFEWWKTEPHDELVSNGAYCLAKPGEIYAVYLPVRPICGNAEAFEHQKVCGEITLKLEPGTYEARWFSAYTGEIIPLPPVEGRVWTLPKTPGWLDWALLLQRKR
ncbi:MAG: hypothetical protein DMG10_09940 [Acidobacteria bacterium]|nr:MAG: hypothetical protein DMG10_09940 [Acidobacteriota bacterium]